jgi:hypothetical protein
MTIAAAPQGAVAVADDRRAIHPDQLRALIQMQRYPTSYVQRVVEHLSFLPGGGQAWQRDVQIRLPIDPRLVLGQPVQPPRVQPTMLPDRRQLFVVSLGMFTRSRFADFTVQDASGRRLSLLTRLQHGFCLTSSFMFKYFSEQQLPLAHAQQPAFEELWKAIYQLFTTVDGTAGLPLVPSAEVTGLLDQILHGMKAPSAEIEEKRTRLEAEYRTLQSVTQYLCWAVGEPGEAISLSATYTMADAPRIPGTARAVSPSPLGSDLPKRLWNGIQRRRDAFAIKRTDFYATTGLGPLNYELRTPAHDHAGSYYFLIKAPESCKVSYLDWGLDNSIDSARKEVDCAFESVHIHNGATMVGPGNPKSQPRSSMPGSKISAFLRADFKDHWPLLIAAVLTIMLAFLAQHGEFVGQGGGISSVLLIAPTALLAYIAQRQSHHYAEATRWLGPVLMVYLVANIGFITSVKYSVVDGDALFGRADIGDDLISAGIALASAGLVLWFFVIGFRDQFIARGFKRAKKPSDSVQRYSKLGLRYGDMAFLGMALALAAVIVGAFVTGGFGWGAARARAVEEADRTQVKAQPSQQSTPAQRPGRNSTPKPVAPKEGKASRRGD